MKQTEIRSFLEALAVGDAFGKATEYCAQAEIKEKLGKVIDLLPPERSLTHQDLFYGQVTDDTEQNVRLIYTYAETGEITAHNTAASLLKWVRETDAADKYMGPSTLAALKKIEAGEDITQAGLKGTTCGGLMRTPSAFLMSAPERLVESVVDCLIPTHNTAAAMEAAMAYAFALRAAADHASVEAICDAACEGAEIGSQYGSHFRLAAVVPSCAARIRYLQEILHTLKDEEALKSFLYNIYGTTLAACDVCAAVFGLFLWAKEDVYLAIRLATEMGGDTDTISCLAASLCCLYAGKHNLPSNMVQLVASANKLDFDALAALAITGRSN